ncbi:MAG TPA: TauD/TfdA family dioxygenase [Planctomycetota bacterium]|nr:TauD/TfdA family dioxygenase [Planctomycetota bacterium]
MTAQRTVHTLSPFGVELTASPPGATLESLLRPDFLTSQLARHRVLIFRGFAPLPGDGLVDFCRRFGELQDFDFGKINELRVKEGSPNYLFTTAAVPLHWDGAFLGQVPSAIFFQCEAAPAEGTGGETLFSDTTRVLAAAPAERRALWEKVRITYVTEKKVHYGGRFTSPLLGRHPRTGEETLRFAEPVSDLNPVTLEIEGIPPSDHAAFLEDLRRRLYDPAVCLAHAWRAGDYVVADNHALLHGRRAFADAGRRHLRRVNIL